jgi:hypothetical protein
VAVRPRRRPDVFLLWSLAIAAGQAWSHQVVFPVDSGLNALGSDGRVWRALVDTPDLGWLAATVAAVLLAAVRRPRRALSVALAAMLVALAFEGSRQAVSSAPHSIQAHGRAGDVAAWHPVAMPIGEGSPTFRDGGATGAVVDLSPSACSPRPGGPARGRAPPSLIG